MFIYIFLEKVFAYPTIEKSIVFFTQPHISTKFWFGKLKKFTCTFFTNIIPPAVLNTGTMKDAPSYMHVNIVLNVYISVNSNIAVNKFML